MLCRHENADGPDLSPTGCQLQPDGIRSEPSAEVENGHGVGAGTHASNGDADHL